MVTPFYVKLALFLIKCNNISINAFKFERFKAKTNIEKTRKNTKALQNDAYWASTCSDDVWRGLLWARYSAYTRDGGDRVFKL